MANVISALWQKIRPGGAENRVEANRERSIEWIDANADPQAIDRQAEKEIRSARAGHPVEEGGGGGGD
ncbi:MAG: hypothetical protein IT303_12255 [Dehalococcoidia bacterium]|nr:hypothetical protein [Dehalococcoidia bacterium]